MRAGQTFEVFDRRRGQLNARHLLQLVQRNRLAAIRLLRPQLGALVRTGDAVEHLSDVMCVWVGIVERNPQTLGKVERLHQTLKRYLARRPPAQSLAELQEQLDAFRHYYNNVRPHRALGGRTPLQAYSARLKARAAGAMAGTYFRVREDRVDKAGKVSLRYDSRLYKIGIGRAYKGRVIKLLIADRDIRVVDSNGELLRELTLDPTRCYQPIRQRLVSTMS